MKLTSIALVTAVIGLGVGIIVWSQMSEVPAPIQEEQMAAIANNAITPAAGTEAAKKPTAAAPVEAKPTVVTPPVIAKEAVMPETKPEQVQTKPEAIEEKPELKLDEEVANELKNNVESGFTQKLSFPLTEEKIIAFAQASIRVRKINNKWDVQIAGAETDAMAIEYNNFAVEEITGAMSKIPGLSLEQYNEMTKLTASDPEFNRIYQVYKQLVVEGYFKNKTAIAPLAATAPTGPLTAAEVAPAVAGPEGATVPATTVPPVAPVTPSVAPAPTAGTAPVTQGSTKPPYSPPASR